MIVNYCRVLVGIDIEELKSRYRSQDLPCKMLSCLGVSGCYYKSVYISWFINYDIVFFSSIKSKNISNFQSSRTQPLLRFALESTAPTDGKKEL